MYRPQFAFPTPAGCRDEEFVYHFSGANTPALNQSIAGLSLNNVPLIFEQDAPFYWRGTKIGLLDSTAPFYVIPNLSVQFQDCYQNNLSDDLVPATQYAFPSNAVHFNSQRLTGPPALMEPEIYCPPGGYLLFFLVAPAPLVAHTYLIEISLYGVKRFKECD